METILTVVKKYKIDTNGLFCGRHCKFHSIDITMGMSHDWCTLFGNTNLYVENREHKRCAYCLDATEGKMMDDKSKQESIRLLEKCIEWIEMELRFPITGADFPPPTRELEAMIEKIKTA